MKILFGVFDWGLGHATRDAPIIDALVKKGHEVHLLSTGRALELLQLRFADSCEYHDVPSMLPRAWRSKHFSLMFALTSPKALRELRASREKVKQILKSDYELVVSDCRIDVYDERQRSLLINHQLRLKSPLLQAAPMAFMAHAMSKYDSVVVPDYPGSPLSGVLSTNPLFKGDVHKIGVLSQLSKQKVEQDIDYFFSLSGPEPQRTRLQQLLEQQLKQLDGEIAIAGGRPEQHLKRKHKNVTYYSFLGFEQQQLMMNRAQAIVSRSGYSTVMDLVELGKKRVLFIPTPGQTEQEYLADLYEQRGWFHHVHQKDVELSLDLADAACMKGFKPKWSTKQSVRNFMKIVNS